MTTNNQTSRAIKFRAWDEKNKKLVYSDRYNDFYAFFESGPCSCGGEDNAQQFTGLFDSNNKEIYEGDVIKRTYDVACLKMKNGEILEGCEPGNFMIEKQIFSEVKWAGTGFDFGDKYRIGWYQKGSFEIAGNIFENPELCSKN